MANELEEFIDLIRAAQGLRDEREQYKKENAELKLLLKISQERCKSENTRLEERVKHLETDINAWIDRTRILENELKELKKVNENLKGVNAAWVERYGAKALQESNGLKALHDAINIWIDKAEQERRKAKYLKAANSVLTERFEKERQKSTVWADRYDTEYQKVTDLKKKNEALKSEIIRLKNQLTNQHISHEYVERFESENKELHLRISDYRKVNEELKRRISTRDIYIESLHTDINSLEKVNEGLVKESHNRCHQLSKENERLKEACDSLEKRLVDTSNKYDVIVKENHRINSWLSAKERTIKGLENEVNLKDAALRELSERVSIVERKLDAEEG